MPKNRLLDALTPATREKLLLSARMVELRQGSRLSQPDQPVTYAYLLTEGVASYVVSGKDGGSAEIGMSGPEALIGVHGLLGESVPVAECLMQVDGEGYRITTTELRKLFDESAEFRHLALQSVQQQILTLSQVAGCNRVHQAGERLARWLLTASDRLDDENVAMTQETLAQMLGTRRTTVASVAGALQRSGLIRYRRGRLRILDRVRLAEAACSCYSVTRQLVDGLYSNPFTAARPGA